MFTGRDGGTGRDEIFRPVDNPIDIPSPNTGIQNGFLVSGKSAFRIPVTDTKIILQIPDTGSGFQNSEFANHGIREFRKFPDTISSFNNKKKPPRVEEKQTIPKWKKYPPKIRENL